MAEAVPGASNPFDEDIGCIERVLIDKSVCKKINQLHCEPGSNEGDNYMSLVKKIEVTGIDEKQKDYKVTLIVKRQIPSLSRRELYRCDAAFDNEIRAYQNIVPLLETEASINVFAKCYFAGRDNNGEMIILEDLRASGYEMACRMTGLTMSHVNLVMREIARVHAASIYLKHMDNTKFTKARRHLREIVYCTENYDFYKGVLATSIREALSSLRASNGDGKLTPSIGIIEQLEPKLYDMVQGFVTKEDNFNVISHGDLWINNIMFKKNDAGEVTDVKFIDLQAMRYTSPVFDIMHFVYTSTKRDVRENSMKNVIGMYCDALTVQLEKIFWKHPEELTIMKNRYCFQSLRQEYFRYALYGLAITMWILPAVTFDPTNIPNLDKIADQGTQAHEIDMTSNITEEYHIRLRNIVLEFYNKGHLRYVSS